MTKTVVALYDSASDAETVTRELSAAGFTDTEVVDNSALGSDRAAWSGTEVTDSSLAAGAPGAVGTPLGAVPESGTTTASSSVSSGILGRLRRAGVPEDDSHMYAEGVRRGGSLVSARVADDRVTVAEEILHAHDHVDISARRDVFRDNGWRQFDEKGRAFSEEEIARARQDPRMPML